MDDHTQERIQEEPTRQEAIQPTSTPTPQERTMAEELASVPFEPLLPAEKMLIAWSLLLGFGLLGVLWWFVTQ